MENIFYVYIYLDPRKPGSYDYGDDLVFDFEPFYVGKGKGRRAYQHLQDRSLVSNTYKNNIIKRIIDTGVLPAIHKLRKGLTDEEACILEMSIIGLIGRHNTGKGPLANNTDGGETTTGAIFSTESRALMSMQRKGKKQTPAQYSANCTRKHSDDHRKKISESQKGIRRLTDEQYRDIANKNRGLKRSEETKELLSKQRRGKKQTPAQYAANCAKRSVLIPFSDFKNLASQSRAKTSRELIAFLSQNDDPKVPKNPYTAYRLRGEWTSWSDVLGYQTPGF